MQDKANIGDVLVKQEQILTDEELTQIRKNLKFIGKDVEGQEFTINEETVIASANAEIFGDYATNIATGQWSIAEGSGTIAKGRASHAEGLATTASGAQSHVEGRYTIAAGGAQHVEGIANIEDTEGNYIHIAGNGIFDARSNAYTLDWDGNGWFAGKITVGENKASVITEEDYIIFNGGTAEDVI